MAFFSQFSNSKQCDVIFGILLFDEGRFRIDFSKETFACFWHVKYRVVEFHAITSMLFADVVGFEFEMLRGRRSRRRLQFV